MFPAPAMQSRVLYFFSAKSEEGEDENEGQIPMKSTLKSAPGLGRGDMCMGPSLDSSMDGRECLEPVLVRLLSRVSRAPTGGEPTLNDPDDRRGSVGNTGADIL
jgi:hypothetical protein